MSLRLDWCSYDAAKYACEKWHYSGCVPNQKTVRVGVWEDGQFIGCVIFGDGANSGMFRPYGLLAVEGCELVRVAVSSHRSAISRIVAIAFRFLRKACPRIRLVISFADPERGHYGGIYQAGGWVFTGMTDAADEYLVNGVRMHGRALRSTRSTHRFSNLNAANVFEWTRLVLDPKVKRIKGSSKYRYLMPLDGDMRRQIEPLRKPYPKRAGSADSGTSANHAERGGATPTPALAR
jgi:hypothetical protein